MDIKSSIRTIPDHPKKGIMFRDITTLLKDPEAFKESLNILEERYKGQKIDIIAGIEARGFIFGAALADRLNLGFVPIRKKGKLPAETISEEYELEYGTDIIEVHKDAIKEGDKVLLIDDLIATGGTGIATINLIKKLGGDVIEACFIIGLPDLGGMKKIEESGTKIFTMVDFEGE